MVVRANYLVVFLLLFSVGGVSTPRTTFDKYSTHKPPPDVMVLAKLIESECGVCPDYEKRLVGQVVLNRVKHPNFKNTLKSVIHSPNQFYYNKAIKPSKSSIKAAKTILKANRTTKILYFYNPRTATDSTFIKSVNVLQMGKYHYFCA